MAKLGRYSADRKKIEALTDTKTVEVADCGTIFTLDKAAGFTVTMPSIASAGKGWWCKFIVKTSVTSNGYTIDLSGSDAITGVIVSGADGTATDSTGTAQVVLQPNKAIIGDQLELVTDGVRWYAVGHSNAHDAIDME